MQKVVNPTTPGRLPRLLRRTSVGKLMRCPDLGILPRQPNRSSLYLWFSIFRTPFESSPRPPSAWSSPSSHPHSSQSKGDTKSAALYLSGMEPGFTALCSSQSPLGQGDPLRGSSIGSEATTLGPPEARRRGRRLRGRRQESSGHRRGGLKRTPRRARPPEGRLGRRQAATQSAE